MHQTTSHLATPRVDRVMFSGERPVFRRLVTRGALLELVTLGFYRFWLATDIRRHLWSNTSVGGDPVEYTGRAKELLIGFLIAMAILVPGYLVGFLVPLLLISFLGGPEAGGIDTLAGIPLFLFLYLFSQFALYRARRYRVTRTVWRGLRFGMGGSGWGYSWRAGSWSLLVLLTAGLALPWRQAALERFKMRHTSYGTLQGRFEGTGSDFFKQAWFLWLLALPAAVLVIPLPFLYGAYKAIEWRWWVSGIRFGDVAFRSDLERSDLISSYWKVVGWSLLLVLVLGLWLVGVTVGATYLAGGSAERIQVAMQHPLVLLALGAGYLVAAIAFGAVVRIYLTRDIWAKIAGRTSVLNLAAADDVTGQGAAVGALGEGFADSLDIGGL